LEKKLNTIGTSALGYHRPGDGFEKDSVSASVSSQLASLRSLAGAGIVMLGGFILAEQTSPASSRCCARSPAQLL
jgi:hypothetical protein